MSECKACSMYRQDIATLTKEYDKLRDALENVYNILTDDWDGLTPEACRQDVRAYIKKEIK